MLFWYRDLPIATKLLLGNLAFALPMVVLIFFMNISFTYDITIGQQELAGTQVLRPLFVLLDRLPQHGLAAENSSAAEGQEIAALFSRLGQSREQLKATRRRGDSPENSEAVENADDPWGLKAEWLALAGKDAGFAAQVKGQAHLVDLIALIGRESGLGLDPAMDSKLLAELLTNQLPRNFAQLNVYCAAPAASGRPGSPAQALAGDPSPEQQHAFSLFRADFVQSIANARLALDQDANYYGLSPSLHGPFVRALDDYRQAMSRFIALHPQRGTQPADLVAYREASNRARQSTQQLMLSGLQELDILIQQRIASYRRWQVLAFACSALALLLASALISAIAKSITVPIRAVIGYTKKISDGDYQARLEGAFQGELKGLAADLQGMVHEIIRLASFPRQNPNPVLAANASGTITYRNGSAEAILTDFHLGVEAFLPPDHRQIVEACLAGGRNRAGIETAAGPGVFEWTYHPLVEQGLVHIYARDITARKRLEDQLRHDAFHDSLTGLANRALFLDRLQQVVAHRRSDPAATFTVLFLDLDGFKLINDSLGHEQGDKLLIAFAERITPLVHPSDTVARLGGDEFTLLLDNIPEDQALAIPNRIQQALERPFPLGGLEVAVSTSIGIVLQPGPGLVAEEILRDANTAMYRAKAKGPGHHVLFDSTMHSQALERLRLEIELKKAIERREFVVFYQPIIELGSGALVGFEALVRWQHPTQGLVPPGLFIPLAEKTGLVRAIGRDVLRAACHQAKSWQEISGHQALMISVNLAVPQLLAPTIMAEIDQILTETGLPPTTLKLEVTESGIMEHIETALGVLHAIKQRGMTLSIDDFGTGYSSLSYLHRFPFDTLKVDQSFVAEMEADMKNREIIRSIVSLAHNLEKKVIVEGIETDAQLALVEEMGCEFGQGYLFAKPLPADEAEELLRLPEPFSQKRKKM